MDKHGLCACCAQVGRCGPGAKRLVCSDSVGEKVQHGLGVAWVMWWSSTALPKVWMQRIVATCWLMVGVSGGCVVVVVILTQSTGHKEADAERGKTG